MGYQEYVDDEHLFIKHLGQHLPPSIDPDSLHGDLDNALMDIWRNIPGQRSLIYTRAGSGA